MSKLVWIVSLYCVVCVCVHNNTKSHIDFNLEINGRTIMLVVLAVAVAKEAAAASVFNATTFIRYPNSYNTYTQHLTGCWYCDCNWEMVSVTRFYYDVQCAHTLYGLSDTYGFQRRIYVCDSKKNYGTMVYLLN